MLLGRGLPPVYERRPAGDPIPEGVVPHWRFRLDHGAPIEWTDLVRGPQKFDPALISDPVVRRADGSWLYLLPSVIDDIDLGISHIVRGEDHVSNSATQVQMFEALGAPVPQFAHEALLVAAEGKLSKRFGAIGVGEMQAAGLEPMALLSLLARLGTSQPVEPLWTLAKLAEGFDFAYFGRAPAHFDFAEVEEVNRKLIHHADFADVAQAIPADISAADFELLKGNVSRLDELGQWRPVLDGDLPPVPVPEADRAFLAEAARIAANLDWSGEPWPALTAALKASTDRKARALFHPLRLALTGRDSGPEMAPLLKRIGKDRALARPLGERLTTTRSRAHNSRHLHRICYDVSSSRQIRRNAMLAYAAPQTARRDRPTPHPRTDRRGSRRGGCRRDVAPEVTYQRRIKSTRQ